MNPSIDYSLYIISDPQTTKQIRRKSRQFKTIYTKIPYKIH